MAATLTRREFVRIGGAGVGAALAPLPFARFSRDAGAVEGAACFRSPESQVPVPTGVSPWAFDIDGSGVIDDRDRALLRAAVGTRRGFELDPLPGYDPSADLFGRGRVTAEDLDAFDAEAVVGPTPPRPVVMCWHYGWYHPDRRPREPTTATYLGGDYNSDDPVVEERFHALKNEFGIGADMLSWIDPSLESEPSLESYERGYFAAPSAATRRFGWLYETAINLRARAPMSFAPGNGQRERLVDHFRQMARRMVDSASGTLHDSVLLIDGRPVVYVFASHLMGTTVVSMIDVAQALDAARSAFVEVAGVAPYLIGDETPFLDDTELTRGRRIRVAFFDAVARYHHYDDEAVAAFAQDGPVYLGGDYLERILAHEQSAMRALAGLRNRFTGAPVLVIPSSAAGFAKVGFPTLLASRGAYERLLRATHTLAEEHRAAISQQPGGEHVPSVAPVIVGSWNEEFEGHALFPAARNEALVPGGRGGFEWLTAIKKVYGSLPGRRRTFSLRS